ncbi:MAG: hypothetical protein J6Y78_00635 [Paludibacteraceae bacterium]|nr:hypothetical protein [Paludibacteraceae bacterium]
MTQAELITEIESQRKWLMFAGIDAYHMDVAFASILSAVLEYSDTQSKVLYEIKDEIRNTLSDEYTATSNKVIVNRIISIIDKYISGKE